MNKKHLFLLLFLCNCAFSQQIEKLTIDSKAFGEKREVLVYLPEAYLLEPQRRFEVIYVFDAQAVQYFDIVHSTQKFVAPDVPVVVVGVVCSFSEAKKQNRNTDFLPVPDHPETSKKFQGRVGNTDTFLQFVDTEVMRQIDANYRTLPMRIGVGHSNGGTFLAHVLLKKPELFDALVLVSPNLEYDEEQIVRRFEQFDPDRLTSEKYIFMCNANESGGWPQANAKMIALLEKDKFKNKIHFMHMDFSKTENHTTVFPIGLFHGFKDFFVWQYEDVTNFMAYYSDLDQKGLVNLESDTMNTMAYNFFHRGQTPAAVAVINWAIEKHPDDANLYDSRGEFYENNGDLENARKSYAAAVRVLESQQGKLDQKTYNEKYSYFKANRDRLNK